jgi:translation initiation factor IF-1
MSTDERISGIGVVMLVTGERTATIKMPNGYCVVGHVGGDRSFDFTRFSVGDSVILEMTPYDMSRGRIISKANIL